VQKVVHMIQQKAGDESIRKAVHEKPLAKKPLSSSSLSFTKPPSHPNTKPSLEASRTTKPIVTITIGSSSSTHDDPAFETKSRLHSAKKPSKLTQAFHTAQKPEKDNKEPNSKVPLATVTHSARRVLPSNPPVLSKATPLSRPNFSTATPRGKAQNI
jgi:hypothetical protein